MSGYPTYQALTCPQRYTSYLSVHLPAQNAQKITSDLGARAAVLERDFS
jgi:hypothetical protein